MGERTLFPIMRPGRLRDEQMLKSSGVSVLLAIPWEMLTPHENQARKNHRQNLQTLASRCGLSACEAVAVLEDRPWRQMEHIDAYRRLHELFVIAANAVPAAPPQRAEGVGS